VEYYASIKLLQNVEDKGEDGSSISDEMRWSAYLFATRKGSFLSQLNVRTYRKFTPLQVFFFSAFW
jgi:hypothetical protein